MLFSDDETARIWKYVDDKGLHADNRLCISHITDGIRHKGKFFEKSIDTNAALCALYKAVQICNRRGDITDAHTLQFIARAIQVKDRHTLLESTTLGYPGYRILTYEDSMDLYDLVDRLNNRYAMRSTKYAINKCDTLEDLYMAFIKVTNESISTRKDTFSTEAYHNIIQRIQFLIKKKTHMPTREPVEPVFKQFRECEFCDSEQELSVSDDVEPQDETFVESFKI